MRNFFRLIFSSFFILWASFSVVNLQAKTEYFKDQRIRKIAHSKTAVYIDQGIFHNGPEKTKSTLKALRHGKRTKRGYERLVFDFSTQSVPKIYGHVSSQQKKIYLDFFDTKLNPQIGAFGDGHYVKTVNFFEFEKNTLTVEIELKELASIDVFTLKNPGRFVIDIKN